MKKFTSFKSLQKYSFGILALFILSCNTHKEELQSSNHQRDSLLAVLQERDSTMNDFLKEYNEVQVNLDSVAHHGGAITVNMKNQGELKTTARQRINEDIAAINDLMKANREKIASLNRKLKSSGNKNAELEK